MRIEIAILAVAVGLLGAPLHGALAAGDSCPPCCSQVADASCENADAPCVALAPTSCCEAAPVAPIAPAKRAPDPPGSPWIASPAARAPAPAPTAIAAQRADGSSVGLPSPFRLSVVLIA